MSRAQQGQVFNTATGENKAYNADAQTSFAAAQGDIGAYSEDVNAYKAANPYVQGGQAETATNQQSADTAAAGAQRAGQLLQGQAVRTGQNAGGAIAATENMEEANARALTAEQARATENRLGAKTAYDTTALGAEAKIPGMQDTLAQQQGVLAQGALGTAQKAGQSPSFMDEFSGPFAKQLGSDMESLLMGAARGGGG